jgi:amino acid adenylation domain-containing protein/non-ribosomal peptide synthase protein (TIGR01720 family)
LTSGGGRDKRWALFEQKLRERGLATASIPKAARDAGRVAASFAQERLLFLEQLTPGSAAYNDHYAIRVRGQLDAALLARVLDEIAIRHETLRTTFEFGPDGEARQVVRDELRMAFSHEVWTGAAAEFEAWMLARAVSEARAPFDLTRGPLARSRLLSCGPAEHVLLFTVHHAVWDGWSSGVLSQELSLLYAALAGSTSPALPQLSTQYADYSAWQRQQLAGPALEQKLEFWRRELEGAPFTIDLPTDAPRPRLQTFSGKTLQSKLGKRLSSQLDLHAREHGKTPFALLLSTFGVLLARYSGQRQLLVATPIANRARVELEGLIGCFVNTLALRVDLTGKPTLSTLSSQVGERLLRAEPHQDLPFEKLIEALDVERDLSRSPVAQVMFVLQNTPPRVLEIAGLTFTPLEIDAGFAKLDLTLNVRLTADGYVAAWEYNSDLFEEATIKRLLGHYQHLLAQLLANPDVSVFDVDLMTAEERRKLLGTWNATQAAFPEQATLHELFVAQARRSPDALALIAGEKRFSYAELEARARVIAEALCERGVGPGGLVGVFLRRDEQLVPALLGVLMSGAAYVPLDPAYPRDRVSLILDDAKAAWILTSAELAARLPPELCDRTIDVSSLELGQRAVASELKRGQATDRAYLIYTSGSTGKPKGVEIEHQSAVAFVSWAHGVFDAEQLRGVLAATSVCFDLSIFEIFGTLLGGGCVILAENALALPVLAARSEVTLVNTVPSAAEELLRANAFPVSVRTINLAGEALSEDLVLGLYGLPHVERVYNLYGPSETTTYSTYTLTTPGAWKPTIGRPISNTRAYVFDEQQKLVPVGVRGELYLAGLGVARGYLDRPQLTAERFLPDPFSDAVGARMYKTGDVARFLASGELEYLGRNDNQVKLRGYRIELGEIELLLRRQPGVDFAVVVVREDRPGVKLLVAYLVPTPGAPLDVEALRAAAFASLPEYMVPARFVGLNQLPLSPNGKVDRKRLPAPAEPSSDRPHVAPRNAVEVALASIWREVLQVEQLGVHDGFFELGGDSIAAMRLATLARRAGFDLSVGQIFQAQTLEALAEQVALSTKTTAAAALPNEPFGLAPIQQWFFERQLRHPNHYNQSLLVELQPGLERAALVRSLGWMLGRHSALRLHFERTEHGYSQRFGAEPRVDVQILELEAQAPEDVRAAIERAIQELEASLDFEQGRLGRVALFEQGGRPKALFLVFHHLVVDVVSWHVLLGDLASAYGALAGGAERPPHAIESNNYAAFVAELARYGASSSADALSDEWLRLTSERAPLPRDFPQGLNLTRSRGSLEWTLDAERCAALGARARAAYKIGIDEVVLTALCSALSSFTGGNRVLIDVERHGRDLFGSRLDLSDAVGWFTALFPLLFEAERDAQSALIAVKEALHGAPDRALSFQALRYGNDTTRRRQLSELPEREVVYNFLGNVAPRATAGSPFALVHASTAASNHHPDNQRSHVLEVTAAVRDGALRLEFTFSRDIHAPSSIARLSEAFAAELQRLSDHLQKHEVGALTRADFPLARLSQAELDAHQADWWQKIEDAYALTPAQHAILVDVLRDPRAGYYVPQLYAVLGKLDPELLEKSLAWLMRRHTALRTAFAWSGLQEPVQLVFSDVPCPISHLDFREDDELTRQRRLDDFLARDRERGFELERAPLFRLLHARWTGEQDLLVWTVHHAVSDGWSLPIVIGEVLAAYTAFSLGREPKLPPVRPFRDYMAWLLAQDQARGEAHFRAALAGAAPSDLGLPEDASYRHVNESTRELDADTTRSLEQLAKRHAVTLGAVVQAAWAVVVARYAGQSDVIFGSVDSGRPAALDRVGDMVGMFVTTLPLRVQVDDSAPLAKLLVAVQDASVALREHAYVALARVASGAGSGLFQSICVIENYPSLTSAADPRLGLAQVSSVETTRFPLTVTASLRERVTLGVSASLLDSSAGPELLDSWQQVLLQMAKARGLGSDAECLVGQLQAPHATRRRQARAYWTAELAGAPRTRLPSDRALASNAERQLMTFEHRFEPSVSRAVAELAESMRVAPASILLGAFAVLVGRYVAASEGLLAVELEPACWAPLRFEISGEMTFGDLVASLSHRSMEARSHFDRFAIESCEARAFVGCATTETWRDTAGASLDLELCLRLPIPGAGDALSLTYDGRLFEADTIEHVARQFADLTRALATRPESRLGDVGLGHALGPVGDPGAGAAQPNVVELFRARVRQKPEALALLSGPSRLSYAALDAQAGAAVTKLREEGVARGDLVAVWLPRSQELIVTLLAIVKAGAAFVAIDHALPLERARFMFEDCGARLCVAASGAGWESPTTRFVDAASLTRDAAAGADSEIGEQDLAYVIYTSGSTGRPKGVMIEHAALANYMSFYAQATGLGPGDRLLQFASPSFDVAVEEIFGALCFGATLVLRSDDITPRGLLAEGESLGLTILGLPTAYFSELTRALAAGAKLPSSVRLVLIGGERAARNVIEDWRQSTRSREAGAGQEPVRLLNMYGPTEATISATYADLTHASLPEREPPIGRPVTGAQALVVDAFGHLVPVGVPGELLLAGRCLARGYLNRPQLTAEKFAESPLAAGRVYRTGDLVRWRPDQQLEYLGRIDEQVKVRGFRVELGEIEAILRGHSAVSDAVVVLRDAATNPRLVAYIVGSAQPDQLRQALQVLPAHMAPAAYVFLERLPVTRNGKIDKRALPAPDAQRDAQHYIAPRTAAEAALVDIWQRVLGIERLGVSDNFFDHGGHSLLATRVVSRVEAELKLEMSVRDLFEAPTVEQLAERLHGKVRVESAALRAQSVEQAPLSFAQQRLWFLDQLEPGSAAYNMPLVMRVSGALDVDSLGRALSELSRRHAVLRSVFVTDAAGQPLQKVDQQARAHLERQVAPSGVDPEAWALARARAEAASPFDLARGPLLRALLLSLHDDDCLLVLNLHHIVFDGWSVSVLVRELGAVYRAFAAGLPSPLAELPIQYADYALWQRAELSGPELERQLTFWKEELSGAPLRLDLPKKPRPEGHSYAGATHHAELELGLAERVDVLAAELSATPFVVLLSAWAVLLSRISREPELVIGTPVANRPRVETEGLIGLFVNTLAVRIDLREEPSFAEVVAQLKERLLRAQAHEDLPFEKLVDALNVERSLERSPIFQVMFAMQNTPALDFDVAGLEASVIEVPSGIAKFDITLNAERSPRGYATSWEYRSDYFDAAFIEQLAVHFARLLQAFVDAPQLACSRAPLLSEAERRRVLVDFNRTERPYPACSVPELVAAQAQATPLAIAVIDETEQLSYRELEQRIELVARRLLAADVAPGARIAVLLPRTAELLVVLLAIQKVRAAYVPLDAALPSGRMQEILDDASVELILTETSLLERLPPRLTLALLCLDQPASPQVKRAELPRPSPDDLAYVLFTSGSTGRPKGVEITQRALTNFLWSMRSAPGILASDLVLAATSLSFDIAGLELYLPLVTGACTFVASRQVATDGQRLAALIAERGITYVQATPSTYKLLLGSGFRGSKGLKLLVGGEQLSLQLAEQLLGCSGSLWNVYGPTETTIWSTCEQLTSTSLRRGVTIGKPIANTQTYVLDHCLEPLPAGVPGELYLGGHGLARGYAGRPELTAARFVPNPFGPGRLYRTGDIARYLDDGVLECFGRVDDQVKVRGYRIELGDIEAAIRRHPEVLDVAVSVQVEGEGDQRLIAYVVSLGSLDAETLRPLLKASLPDYMVPQHFVTLERLPTTPNGKLDRKALPKATFAARPDRVPPRDENERNIAAIFEELLHIRPIGVFDSFFDLGGHSLLGTELLFRLRRELGFEIPVRALFEAPTVAGLAQLAQAPVTRSGMRLPQNVVLARQGGGVPWVFFPALAGTAAPYLASVVNDAGPSVYLLEAPGLDGRPPLDSVEALAKEFAGLIRDLVSSRRVRLLGWSFGALTGFTTARILADQGWTIDELLLVDPALPGMTLGELDEGGLALAFIADVAESLGKASTFAQAFAGARARARNPSEAFQIALDMGIFPSRTTLADFENRLSVYTASARALRDFSPSASRDIYRGRAFILAASEGNGPQASGWLRFLPEARLSIQSASHHTILEHLRNYLG